MRRQVLLAALVGVVGATLAGPALSGPAWADPAPERARVDHVVVVGVAGLRWADVSAGRTPTLARLAATGSVGSLSVRAAPAVTCPGEGWLTLGSGTYAMLRRPGNLDPDAGCRSRAAPEVHADGAGGRVAAFGAVRAVNDRLRFGAEPGVLGGGVRCAAAVGPGAALAVADRDGRVAAYRPALPDDPGTLLARCPLAAVDLGSLPEATADRADALARFDRALARVDATRPAGSVLVVAGVSEVEARQPRLHVAVVDGPGFRGGWLHSPSTRRHPYVQLSDLAPTALALLGEEVPEQVAGRPLAGAASGRPATFAATRRALVDTDAAAVAQRAAVAPFFVGYGALLLIVLGGLAVLLRRRRTGRPVPARLLRVLTVGAVAATAVPAATFLANTLPWWRTAVPTVALGGAVALAAAAVTGLAYAGPWRGSARGVLGAVGLVTFAVFVVDVATGARLQLDSLLGYNPLVAGRFTGIGGIGFAVFGAAVVLAAAALADGRSRPTALAWVAAVGVPAVALDGLPSLGAKFGGVLALVPTLGVLALLVARARVTVARLLAVVAGGVVVVAVLSVVDYLGPSESRSHFGRFVATVLAGDGEGTLRRKLLTNLDLLFTGPLHVAALGVVVLAAVVVLRPPAVLRAAYDAQPWLRTALVSVVALGAIGFAVNDSGIAVPVVAGLVALPAALAACAWPGPAGQDAPGRAEPDMPTVTDTTMSRSGQPAELLP